MSADPFEGLEVGSPETLAWEAEQDAATLRSLDSWPHRERLRALLATLPPSKGGPTPAIAGGRWFSVRDGRDLCVDGASLVSASPTESVWDFWPSPDGAFVAVATAAGAAEGGELRLVDVASGAIVGRTLLFSSWTRLSWAPDGGGFYFNGIDIREDQLVGVLWHVSVDGRADRVPTDEDAFDLYPDVSVDGQHVVIARGATRLRPAFLLDRSTSEARPLLRDLDVHTHGVLIGDEYIAVTNVDADRGRLVAIPIHTAGDQASWSDLVPEGAAIMRAVSYVADRLVISEYLDGSSRLRTCALDGRDMRIIELPNHGVGVASAARVPLPGVAMFRAVPGSSTITFRFSSTASPPAAYAYDVERDELTARDRGSELSTASTLIAPRAADGTELAAWVTVRHELRDRGRLPALVTVYGGWNLPNSPSYSPALAAFVASGGVVVHAIVRGGSERGDSWWQAGRREHKQNTFDDLYAIVDHLVATGTVDPTRVALQGGSAGGLAAAVAGIQRPDLFRAVVATAPALDLLRIPTGPGTAQATIDSMRDELGSDHDALAAYSPYETVHAAMPAMFVGATSEDIRTPAWHARKFVAKAHALHPERPVFLRIWKNAGHGTNAPPGNQISNDWLAFVMRELQVEPAPV